MMSRNVKLLSKTVAVLFALQVTGCYAMGAAKATAPKVSSVKADSDTLHINAQDLQSALLYFTEPEVATEVKKTQSEAEKAMKKMIQDSGVEEMAKKLESSRSAMSAAAIATEEAKIKKIQESIQQEMQRWQTKMQEILQRQFEKVVKAIEAYARKHGYKKVVDIATGQSIWMDPSLDKTDEVVKALNDAYNAEKASKKPAAPKA